VRRTSLTFLAYGLMGAYGYLSYALGAVVPDLRADLGLSATAAGLHPSAFAIGMTLAGLGTARAVRGAGRRAAAWAGAALLAAGTALVAAGGALAATVPGALLIGLGGGVALATVGAALASEHGAQGPRAVLEGNVVASAGGVLAPVLIALAIAVGLGWRAGLAAALIGLLALALRFARVPLGRGEAGRREAPPGPLPAAYWLRWTLVLGIVAGEFSLVFWAGSFLREEAGLGTAAAVAGAALFNAGMLAGRAAGSRLAVAVRDPAALVRAGALLGLAGVLAFWLVPAPALRLAGLLLAGLGMANLYPAGYALALGAASGRSDQASSRLMLASGAAILLAPLGLAALADAVGLGLAVGVVPALLVATLGVALAVAPPALGSPRPEPRVRIR